MEIITPGIRFKGENLNDQKRVMSPEKAFQNGATSIVMGRSLIKGDIKNFHQVNFHTLNFHHLNNCHHLKLYPFSYY